MQYVRVLYGENLEEVRPKLLKDLRRTFGSSKQSDCVKRFLREDVVYYTMGKEASDTLREHGIRNVIQVMNKPIKVVSGGVLSWNKLYLIRCAMEDFGSVLYTDIDIYLSNAFDPDGVTEILQQHGGMGAMLQMPVISYKKKYFWFRPRRGEGWDKITPRVGLFGCFIYATDVEMVDHFFEDYKELTEESGRKAGDEQFITYSLDKRFGPLTLRELYENFSPEVINDRCSFLRNFTGKKPNAIFNHRR